MQHCFVKKTCSPEVGLLETVLDLGMTADIEMAKTIMPYLDKWGQYIWSKLLDKTSKKYEFAVIKIWGLDLGFTFARTIETKLLSTTHVNKASCTWNRINEL